MCQHLVPIFLSPQKEINMREKALEFYNKWNFPNCVAGVDGKHIRMFCPKNSGPLFLPIRTIFR